MFTARYGLIPYIELIAFSLEKVNPILNSRCYIYIDAFPTYVYEVCEDEDLLAPLCVAVRPVCCSLDLAGSCSLWPSSPTVKCLTSFHVK